MAGPGRTPAHPLRVTHAEVVYPQRVEPAQATMPLGAPDDARRRRRPDEPRTLIPQPPAAAIARSALDELLERATVRRLTTVCAGPGWGKTIAVAGWLERRSAHATPVAWVTAQAQSDNPASFWDMVLAALGASGAVPADHPLQSLSATAGVREEVLASIFRSLDALPDEVLLVVDDFHEISDRAVLESLTLATERATNLRILLLSRVVPGLPLHRLRLSGELSEVTAQDLAFTAADVRALARSEDLALAASQVDLILERTEGWPAGIRLALLAARRQGVAALASFAGTERSVAEYLVAEVLERNDPLTRDFLLRTSVAGLLCAELAGALAPGAPGQQLLEMLEARNEFVTSMGSDRRWHRYHPLLRDLLEHTLRRDDPAAHRAAHTSAARWWAVNGDPIQALGHAAAAEDWDLFGWVYTTGAGPSLVGVHRAAVAGLLRRVPVAALPETPSTHLQQAGLALMAGQLVGVATHVDRAREALLEESQPDVGAQVLTELLTCAQGRHVGDAARVVRAASRAIELLEAAGPMPAAAGYRAIAVQNLGVGQLWSGDLLAAGASFREVIAGSADATDVDITRLGARSHLALVQAAEADLASALQTAAGALEAASGQGWSSLLQVRSAHLAAALVHSLHGEPEAAHAATAAGLAAVTGGVEPGPTLLLHVVHAEIAISHARPRAAAQSVRQALASAQGWQLPDFLADALVHAVTEAALLHGVNEAGERLLAGLRPDSPVRSSCLARRRLAAGDLAGATRIAEAVVAQGEHESVAELVALVDAWLVIALARDRDWSAREARAATCRAVELARPQGLVRPFLVTGSPRMPVLLAQVLAEIGADPFIAGILEHAAGSSPGIPEPAPLVEPLTDRELVVLRSLPTLRSNAEIADDLYVSVNTVKAHLKGLYRKLGVSGRREAVERARELGLLG
jgi:LuxR family transcriptional regulator, maltose regulon positive regulatory protein